MARPNTRKQRKRDILTAAGELIARHDVASLRMADVAAELGLTANAIRYYFKDVDELLAELCAWSDERFYTVRRERARELDDVREKLAVTIAAGLPVGPEDLEWRVIWRAVLSAGFEFDKRPAVQRIYHRQVGLYAEILTEGVDAGVFTLVAPPRDVAMTIMSLEDYLGYRIVARDPDVDRATALRLVRGYAEMAVGSPLPATD